MSDENENEKTAKLEGLFENTQTDTAPAEPVTEPAADAAPQPTAAQPTAAQPTTALPEAEPAWLGHWAPKPARTTPRIRWGGIVWGLVFAATGWFALWTLLAEGRRAAFSDWILTLDDGGWAVVTAFALGALLLVVGVIEGLRAFGAGSGDPVGRRAPDAE